MKKLSKLLNYKNKLPILNNILASEGYLYSTNIYLITVCKSPDFIKEGLYHMNGLENEQANVSEYPCIKSHIESDDYFPITTLDKLTLSQLIASASNDLTRLQMCGAFVDIENKCIVSTSGYSLFKLEITTNFTGNGFIIPLDALKKVATFKSIDISYSTKRNNICLSVSEGEVYCTPISREYPRYHAVIPKARPNYSCNLPAETLAYLLESIKLDKDCTIIFNADNIEVSSKKYGIIANIKDAEFSHNFTQTAFRAEIFKDAIGKFKGAMTLNFNSPASPCVVKFIGEQNKMAIAMPVRI